MKSVKVVTYDLAVSGHDHTDIKSAYSAKMSTPYSTAVAIIYGKAGLQEFEESVLDDEIVKTLTKKVEVVADQEMSRIFPEKQSALVTITTDKGCYLERVDYPKGEPENPLEEKEFCERYEALMEYGGVNMAIFKNIYKMIGRPDVKISELIKYL